MKKKSKDIKCKKPNKLKVAPIIDRIVKIKCEHHGLGTTTVSEMHKQLDDIVDISWFDELKKIVHWLIEEHPEDFETPGECIDMAFHILNDPVAENDDDLGDAK